MRTARVAPIFGTVASFRFHGSVTAIARVQHAADAALADLTKVDRVLSPFRPDSDLSRIRTGELALSAGDPMVGEVARLCADFEQRTGGLFAASWNGGFDPTGLVKGWAVERAAARLASLVGPGTGVEAVGVSVGGDMRLFTAADSEWTWPIGVVDPADPSRVAGLVEVRNGAVATSGIAERGAHIIDPRSGHPVTAPVSATVIAPSLTDADVWATAAVVAGFDDLSWISVAPETTGMLLHADGRARRWIRGVEVSVSAAT
ncbi:FAD:protein FMN transferase [Microbacterium gorillae]|uniref:FAD:protein FMN transferase n=1 Tax=Microbacterium gorillae TaxID=1231063 RepID=UPI00058EE581|nr:FAD:protein FMN transferase [Microbacterium gorillae]